MGKKYVVRLTEQERDELQSVVKKGTAKAYRVKHANILLKADANGPGWTDQKIAEAFGCHSNTVVYVRQRFVEEGLERALGRKKQRRPSRAKLLDGEQEAQLIAVSCGPPPEGRARWTLRLLSQRLVEMEIAETISHETVRQVLKKTSSDRT
jgi:transposase